MCLSSRLVLKLVSINFIYSILLQVVSLFPWLNAYLVNFFITLASAS